MGRVAVFCCFLRFFASLIAKIDYVHSCVTKRFFDSTKVLYLSIDF